MHSLQATRTLLASAMLAGTPAVGTLQRHWCSQRMQQFLGDLSQQPILRLTIRLGRFLRSPCPPFVPPLCPLPFPLPLTGPSPPPCLAPFQPSPLCPASSSPRAHPLTNARHITRGRSAQCSTHAFAFCRRVRSQSIILAVHYA